MAQSMWRSRKSDQAGPGTPAIADDYKVAIFCALSEEADAVMATFTSHFKPAFPKAPSDTNAYSLGLIATHNVVLVHMAGMGKSIAARAAANCRATFHNLKVALVVGICGGVPNIAHNEQIYLGDVIVSNGMEFYDFGRQFPHRFIRKTDTHSMPTRHSTEIKALLAKFATSYCRQRCQELTVTYLRDLENLDRFRGVYPGENEDKVFAPKYRHKHHDGSCSVCAETGGADDDVCDASLKMSCEELGCDEAHLLRKGQPDKRASANDRQTPSPDVKFGEIASGDKVMKSGEERDAVAREMDIIAFEMEGAGVWDTFQGNCLVIKAACDYADSHKSKKWQKYAALTAAAFTKAFLEEWS